MKASDGGTLISHNKPSLAAGGREEGREKEREGKGEERKGAAVPSLHPGVTYLS